ncbi:MAG: hypothetical protein ABTQ25_16710 [Nitrosomonas ureae]
MERAILQCAAFINGKTFCLLLESHIEMMRYASWGALVGIVPPILVMATTYFQGGVFQWPKLAVALWPTSTMLMGTMGQEWTPWAIIIFVLSVLLNQILYGAMGLLTWLLRQRLTG